MAKKTATSTKTTSRAKTADKTFAGASKSIMDIKHKMDTGKKLTQAERTKMRDYLWKNDVAE